MANPESEVKVGGSGSSVNQRRWPDDIVNFLNLVMKTFEHQPDTYRVFFSMMADYRNYRVSAECLIVRVHFLFKEHKELLEGFYQFVPKQYQGCHDFDFEDVIAFVNKIKLRFSQELNVFESFVEILHNYRTGTYALEYSSIEISKLLEGHPDLLREYRTYLPPVRSRLQYLVLAIATSAAYEEEEMEKGCSCLKKRSLSS